MTSALFSGLAELAVSVFAEDVTHISNSVETTLSAKVRTDYVTVDDGETYNRVKFLHFSDDALTTLGITLAVDDVLTVRENSYKILDISSTGRGMSQVRLGEVV